MCQDSGGTQQSQAAQGGSSSAIPACAPGQRLTAFIVVVLGDVQCIVVAQIIQDVCGCATIQPLTP
jgi:hypothetical protein